MAKTTMNNFLELSRVSDANINLIRGIAVAACTKMAPLFPLISTPVKIIKMVKKNTFLEEEKSITPGSNVMSVYPILSATERPLSEAGFCIGETYSERSWRGGLWSISTGELRPSIHSP